MCMIPEPALRQALGIIMTDVAVRRYCTIRFGTILLLYKISG